LARSEAAPCPLQPCYFDKWDLFADTWDCQYAMGFPECIFVVAPAAATDGGGRTRQFVAVHRRPRRPVNLVLRPWRSDIPPPFQVGAGDTCGGIHSEKRKGRKSLFLIYGTTFKKNESGRDFQRGQIWNDRSQKPKKNYSRHPLWRVIYLGRRLKIIHN